MTGTGPGRTGDRRVLITGIGCVTPIGTGVEGLWDGLRACRSAVRPIETFDASPFRSRIAAAVTEFAPRDFMGPKRAKRLDRFAQFSVAAARLSLEDAGLDAAPPPADRTAIQLGTALGGVAYAEGQLERFLARGPAGVDPLLALSVFGGSASCNVAIEFGFTGPNATNAMSCASGAIGIGEGWRLIRDDLADVALVGGVEAPLAPLCFGSFAIIRAMSTRNDDPEAASRPFDRDRDGFVMGEGAALLVLEERSRALARGARPYAELLGYATTSDAHHMTAPREDGAQAARALRAALDIAGAHPGEVDLVSAHGSSTPLNDPVESRVIRDVLGEATDRAVVTGIKGYYGHALGASGAIEAAATALSVSRGWVPPTLNLQVRDPACDVPLVEGHGREMEIRTAVSNSFGFGGINAVLVLGAADG